MCEVEKVSKINVGIVGTGHMGKAHTISYMKNTYAQVYGVCTDTVENAQAFADGGWEIIDKEAGSRRYSPLYKIPKAYKDYKEMAGDPDIQAVSITTPNILHYEIAMEMMNHGKHVLIEKPMAINSSLASGMVKKARENGVVLATGHMWRYHDDVNYIKQKIAEGAIGDIVQTKSYGVHLRWGPGGWFVQKAQAGGGALIDMGVHAIDTTRFLLGEPGVESVYAVVATKFGSYDVDDYAQIIVKFDNGVTSLFESGWNFPFISGTEASTEIWGTKGYARVFPTSLISKTDAGWNEIIPENNKESKSSYLPYARQIDDFLKAVESGAHCITTGYETGLEVMKIVDAAYESSVINDVVKFT